MLRLIALTASFVGMMLLDQAVLRDQGAFGGRRRSAIGAVDLVLLSAAFVPMCLLAWYGLVVPIVPDGVRIEPFPLFVLFGAFVIRHMIAAIRNRLPSRGRKQ